MRDGFSQKDFESHGNGQNRRVRSERIARGCVTRIPENLPKVFVERCALPKDPEFR